ncbi:MAG: hypothetical protein JNK12_21805 [Acidimicrobiales bacterium]|nr:hypothetical protein [Acidimicrobiales bacterium]
MTTDPLPRTAAGREEVARRLAELDELEPYLALAREIRREVERVAADDDAGAESIVAAIDRFPLEERERVARAVFDRLAPERQWEVIERVFGDEEVRGYLQLERAARREQARRTATHHALAIQARTDGLLDTRLLPAGTALTLGLFREPEVAAAVRRGSGSTTCVRRLVLRAEGDRDGALRVVEDVFDPSRGYFVTGDYDERTWRSERIESHDLVQVGALTNGTPTEAEGDPAFAPVLVPGARVDVCRDGEPIRGRLHLGFAKLAEDDVFAG